MRVPAAGIRAGARNWILGEACTALGPEPGGGGWRQVCSPGTLQAPAPCTQLAAAAQPLEGCEGAWGGALLLSMHRDPAQPVWGVPSRGSPGIPPDWLRPLREGPGLRPPRKLSYLFLPPSTEDLRGGPSWDLGAGGGLRPV